MNRELVDTLRLEAKLGATVPELVRLVLAKIGPQSRFAVTMYFMAAFNLPLRTALELNGWNGYGDGYGDMTNNELQRVIGPLIAAALKEGENG
ncbi:MAG: hypothetical protein IPK82_06055 [Polyangiaceae bacterium]|nr:hypothetical protein [Polyangiaceae bacterium]